MKPIFSFCIFTTVVFSGCKKAITQPNFGTINATVNATAHNSTYCFVQTDGRNFTFYGLFGTSLDQPHVEFNIYTFTGTLDTGIYPIDGIQKSASWDSTATISLSASHGVIKINSATTQIIAGSFQFTCVDSTIVIGTFSAGRR